MIQMHEIKVPAGIRNPEAYRRAAYARIMARIEEKRRKEAAARMVEWMTEERAVLIGRLNFECSRSSFEFYHSLREAFIRWGRLTPGQEAALEKAFQRQDARKAEREAADANHTSRHVGTVGGRGVYDLTFKSRIIRDAYSISFFEDAEGCRYQYAGNDLGLTEGQTVRLRATVKGHIERNGVPVTQLNRPTVEVPDERPSEDEFLAARFTNGAKGIKL